MKIFLTVIFGQDGRELTAPLGSLGQVVGFDHGAMNLANPDAIYTMIRDIRPDLIVSPAAYTAVDQAGSEPNWSWILIGLHTASSSTRHAV